MRGAALRGLARLLAAALLCPTLLGQPTMSDKTDSALWYEAEHGFDDVALASGASLAQRWGNEGDANPTGLGRDFAYFSDAAAEVLGAQTLCLAANRSAVLRFNGANNDWLATLLRVGPRFVPVQAGAEAIAYYLANDGLAQNGVHCVRPDPFLQRLRDFWLSEDHPDLALLPPPYDTSLAERKKLLDTTVCHVPWPIIDDTIEYRYIIYCHHWPRFQYRDIHLRYRRTCVGFFGCTATWSGTASLPGTVPVQVSVTRPYGAGGDDFAWNIESTLRDKLYYGEWESIVTGKPGAEVCLPPRYNSVCEGCEEHPSPCLPDTPIHMERDGWIAARVPWEESRFADGYGPDEDEGADEDEEP